MVYATFHGLIQRIGNQPPHQLHRNENTHVSSSKIVLEEPLLMPQPARSSGHDEVLSVNREQVSAYSDINHDVRLAIKLMAMKIERRVLTQAPTLAMDSAFNILCHWH